MNGKYLGLLGLTAVIGSVWGLLHWHDASDHNDRYLLMFIAGTYALAVLVMVIGTVQWTVRSLGLLATMSGDVLLYMLLLGNDVPQHLIRALFLVGSIFLLYGLLRWIHIEARDRFENMA